MAREHYEAVTYNIPTEPGQDRKGGWNGEAGSAQKRYAQGKTDRQPYVDRAQRCALLTVPALHRYEGSDGGTDEIVPWQSIGAAGINNLSAKEIIALFPPGLSFMRLKASKAALDEIAQMPPEAQGQVKQAIARGLSKVEREVIDCIEEDGDRMVLFDTFRHLNVAGNHALKFNPKTAALSSYSLEEYVVWRDRPGTVLEAVIEDVMAWETLPVDLKRHCMDAGYELSNSAPCQEPVKVYTWITLNDGRYHVEQELCGRVVEDSDAFYPQTDLPFLFLRMVAQKGENYGRSYAEDFEGDLQTVDGLWQVMTECAAAIAKLIRTVRPGGVTSRKAVAEASNGDVIAGDADDVKTIQAEKAADMSTAANRADKVEERLSRAFLLFTPRTGERVTATEIQQTIKELETALGGVYSNLVTGLQAPYARIKLGLLWKAGRITKLPKDSVKVQILTGASALGRYAEGQQMSMWAAAVPQWLLERVAPYINAKTFLDRLAVAFSVDEDDLVLTDEQVQASMQAQQAQQLTQQVAPEVVKQGGEMLNKQIPQADAQAA